MFRLWIKLIKDNHMIRDMVFEDGSLDTRTHKIKRGIDKACYDFDLGHPTWLQLNISDFKRNSKTRFTRDSFHEDIAFDYMEIQVIEE